MIIKVFITEKFDNGIGISSHGNIAIEHGRATLSEELNILMEENSQKNNIAVYTCASLGYMDDLEISVSRYSSIIFKREAFNW
jgi:hypothetical protein